MSIRIALPHDIPKEVRDAARLVEQFMSDNGYHTVMNLSHSTYVAVQVDMNIKTEMKMMALREFIDCAKRVMDQEI